MTSCTEVATFLVNQHVLGARLASYNAIRVPFTFNNLLLRAKYKLTLAIYTNMYVACSL